MATLYFKVKLLSDVILNVKSASEGNNQTLDYIPGSCFMGILAKEYDKFKDLINSKNLKISDAHLAANDLRSHKIPLNWFYGKGMELSEGTYISPKEIIIDKNGKQEKIQPKQCRSGFYSFFDNKAIKASCNKNFAIKSAYDSTTRTSKDSSMYGYESLQKGAELYFFIEVENENLENDIVDFFDDKQFNIGRSKSSQYGRIKIEVLNNKEGKHKTETSQTLLESGFVYVYADSRLVLMDKNGNFTLNLKPEYLGFKEDDKIDFSKSQIATFSYSPYNSTRKNFDADICGIEKGSVIVIKTNKEVPQNGFVGNMWSQGFGYALFNPEFLKFDDSKQTICKVQKTKPKDNNNSFSQAYVKNLKEANNDLCSFLAEKMQKEINLINVVEKVKEYFDEYKDSFKKSERYASQWGNIRQIAMQYKTKDAIEKELFTKTKKDTKGQEVPNAYLTHGIAAEKWEFLVKDFQAWFNSVEENIIQETLVNLSSQMAKYLKSK